jgi:hypothetical protein
MHSMAQYGGAGAPANYMSNIMQFGMPTNVGQPVLDVARTGGTGQWGQMLQNLALGGGPMAQYLAPFLNKAPYQAPAMNWGKANA